MTVGAHGIEGKKQKGREFFKNGDGFFKRKDIPESISMSAGETSALVPFCRFE